MNRESERGRKFNHVCVDEVSAELERRRGRDVSGGKKGGR